MKTIALVIGISTYKDSAFTPLPGALEDAKRFSNALTSWGLPSEWIFQLCDEKATKANIIKAFYDCRDEFDVEAKFILYFAGHGQREQDGSHLESSLILHDTDSQNSLGSGLRLAELMQLIRGLKPQQTFLFIDACHVRLNHLENPLNDTDIFSTTNSKGLFCLFSSGVLPSYEDLEHKGGYFTSALLKAIGELRHAKQPTCHDILKKVENSLYIQDLPTPEAYHIGSSQIWPLENHYATIPICYQESPSLVERSQALATLQDHLSKSTTPIIWMWGEAGLGKTVIAEQLKKCLPNAIGASFPNTETLSMAFQSVIEQIRAQKSELFFNRAPDSLLHLTLAHIKAEQPDALIILDHFDRLSQQHLQEVISHLDRVNLPFLLISRHTCPHNLFKNRKLDINEWHTAPFNADEIEVLIEKSGLQNSLCETLVRIAHGNALKTRQMLAKLSGQETPLNSKMTKEAIKCITAICSCGGFLDEALFCHNYGISHSSLATLEQFGLIRYSKNGCFPHDALEELVEEHQWPLNLSHACRYWNTQILHTPYNRFACRSLVILAAHIKDCRPFKRSLAHCLETLNEREYRSFLLDLATIFKRHNWKELLLKASDYLIDHEEYQLAGEILQELMHTFRGKNRHHAIKNAIRRLVWIGKYTDAIKLYEEVSTTCRSEELALAMRNHVGIAHFFLGNFDIAIALFDKNMRQTKSVDEREIGITKYMLGLIMTYRNENLTTAKKLLEASILIFESSKFYHWSIVGLNGLAVLHSSMQERIKALFYLQKALEISEALQNKTFLLQTLKNTARVQLRHFGPYSAEIQITVEALEQILKEVLEVGHNWASMWAQNILCTVYAHRNEPQKMHHLLQDVSVLTKNYDECHIFTLSNMGHFAALNSDYNQARQYYRQAYALCKKARIPLAEIEIRHDFLACNLPLHLQEGLL